MRSACRACRSSRKSGEGEVEMIRMLTRPSAPMAINQALVVTAPARLREHLTGLNPARASGWAGGSHKYALRSLARRYPHLEAEIQRLTRTAAPALVDGFHRRAASNPDRLHSEAAFASLCGVNPIPASSGKTRTGIGSTEAATARPTRHFDCCRDFVLSGPRHTCVVAPPRE